MKRRLLKLGLLVLAGAIVNVGVAWGCAVWTSPALTERSSKTPRAIQALHDVYGPAGAFEKSTESRYTSLGRHRVRLEASLKPFLSDYDVTADYCGLPLLAMQGQWSLHSPFYQLEYACRVPEWVPTRSDFNGYTGIVRFLPLCPIWPGFAINTIFYAVILWLLFAAPFKVRRWRRIRGGLCPACAYPVGASETCTECGTRLRGDPR